MKKIIHLFFAAAFIFTCSNSFGQVQPVLKAMDGATKIIGGSTVAGHVNEIDLFSYSQGEANCATCSKAEVSDLSVLMALNQSNIAFKKLLMNGKKLTSVDVTYIKPGATTPIEYYKIHMEDVTVESFQESGSSENPTVSVSFAPARIAWQFTALKPNGTAGAKTSYGWDVALNVDWLYNF